MLSETTAGAQFQTLRLIGDYPQSNAIPTRLRNVLEVRPDPHAHGGVKRWHALRPDTHFLRICASSRRRHDQSAASTSRSRTLSPIYDSDVMCPLCDSERTYYPKSTTRVYSNSPLSTPVRLILLPAFYHDLTFTSLVASIPRSRTCSLSCVLLMSRIPRLCAVWNSSPHGAVRAPITAALDLVEYRK